MPKRSTTTIKAFIKRHPKNKKWTSHVIYLSTKYQAATGTTNRPTAMAFNDAHFKEVISNKITSTPPVQEKQTLSSQELF